MKRSILLTALLASNALFGAAGPTELLELLANVSGAVVIKAPAAPTVSDLLSAVRGNNLGDVEDILQLDPDLLNAQNGTYNNSTALILATDYASNTSNTSERDGYLAIVEKLIALGADKTLTTSIGQTAYDFTKGKSSIDAKYKDMLNPDASSATGDDDDDDDEPTDFEKLLEAIGNENTTDMMDLLQDNEDLLKEKTTGSGATPLIVAAIMRKGDSIEFLVKAGADKSATDNDGRTAYDHVKDVDGIDQKYKDMLNPGGSSAASGDDDDDSGSTVDPQAVLIGQLFTAAQSDRASDITILAKNPNFDYQVLNATKESTGNTALITAAALGNDNALLSLLDCEDIDVTVTNKQGQTAANLYEGTNSKIKQALDPSAGDGDDDGDDDWSFAGIFSGL